jgi:hypothetical protein
MELLGIDYTTTSQTVTVPAGATTGTVYQQQLRYIDENNEDLFGTAGYWNNQ